MMELDSWDIYCPLLQIWPLPPLSSDLLRLTYLMRFSPFFVGGGYFVVEVLEHGFLTGFVHRIVFDNLVELCCLYENGLNYGNSFHCMAHKAQGHTWPGLWYSICAVLPFLPKTLSGTGHLFWAMKYVHIGTKDKSHFSARELSIFIS